MSFPDSTFDIVFESTLFMMLPDEEVASESRPNAPRPRIGATMIADWLTRAASRDHRAVTPNESLRCSM